MVREKALGLGLFFLILTFHSLAVLLEVPRASEAFFPLPFSWKWLISLIILCYLSAAFRERSYRLALSCIWAGFLGNVATYLIWHSYIDTIPTGFSYINTADLVIGIGCILFVRELIISWRLQT